MPSGAKETTGTPDLAALDAMTLAVEEGSGLPDVVRAAARVLGASLVVTDRSGSVLAEAARSPADVKSMLADAKDVEAVELRVGDQPVGLLRIRAVAESDERTGRLVRLVTTLVASEVERVRAPDRASEQAVDQFVQGLLARRLTDSQAIADRAAELGLDLGEGASVVVARAHPRVTVEDGWRERVRAVALRGARAAVQGTVAALPERAESSQA